MRIFILLLAAAVLSSCELLNPDESAVSFIHIEDMPLEVRNDGATEGVASENIRDVWLSVDGEVIGGFEMPVTIPVLKSGPVSINAFAGILANGSSTDRRRYPFYDFHTETIVLEDEEITVVQPVARYIEENLVFYVEDFEDPGIQMLRSPTSDTSIMAVPNPDLSDLLRENRVGSIYLDDELDHFKVQSTFELDLAGRALCYMELDYRCSEPFRVGLKTTSPSDLSFSVVGFNPKLDINGDPIWNKVYINFGDAIDYLQNAEEYELFLEAEYSGSESAVYQFDNIKIVHPSL